MLEEKTDLLLQYQSISNKLKKKRLLKKPNVIEAYQQFEQLASSFEREDLPHYAGLCYQAAAKCQHSLGNNLEEAYLLLKSSRQFMSSYLRYLNDKSVPNESFLHHSYMYYNECLTRLKENKDCNKLITNAIMGSVMLEMANNLTLKADCMEEGCNEYGKALEYFESPVEKINCLQKIITIKIKLGDYTECLNLTNNVLDLTKSLPDSGLREDIVHDCEIIRLFLLLILQPTPQQISSSMASVLEKYAWVETSSSSDVKDCKTKLMEAGLSKMDENLFLNLQSLVMACQYCDTDCLDLLECDLMPVLNNNQRTLLHVLLKQYQE